MCEIDVYKEEDCEGLRMLHFLLVCNLFYLIKYEKLRLDRFSQIKNLTKC